ncbi:MAG: hypothetical protein ACKV2V_19760 [Blastocatellia bacterium]
MAPGQQKERYECAFQQGTFGFAGRPANGRRNLGWLPDVSADMTVSPRTALTIYYGGVRGGNVQSGIYPRGGARPGLHFAYIELTRKL